MEIIKNYLESIFRSLPKTEKVLRAKSELLQMMEDKYTELIENGISENEAIGTVISEFGNLDELAGELGISEEITVKKNVIKNSRNVSFEDVQAFLSWRKKVSIYRAIGIGCCVCCIVPPIITSGSVLGDVLGPVFMFLMIAIGVCLIVFAGKGSQDWSFLRRDPCSIDDKTYNYVSEKRHEFTKNHSILISASIGCFVLCCVPPIVFSSFNSYFFDNLGASFIFIFVAVGIFLNIYAGTVKASFNFILGLNNSNNYFAVSEDGNKGENNQNTNGNVYYHKSWNNENEEESVSQIKNPKLRAFLSVYWVTITCLYLSISFLTCAWHITWIIWPISAVVFTIIKAFAAKS